MPKFPNDHVFILPHVQEYQRFYSVSVAQVLLCLNEPEMQEGLADDHYTAEKTFNGHRVYVYYYLTLPLQGDKDEVYAIVDFVGYTAQEDLPNEMKPAHSTLVEGYQSIPALKKPFSEQEIEEIVRDERAEAYKKKFG